jgi:hypothetical protein
MAEEQKDTARTLQTAGQKSTLSQASETGTPTTPGGGPEPTAPTRRMNEPASGPAGSVASAAKTWRELGTSTDHATSQPAVTQGTSSSGNVVEADHDFTHEPLAHRQQIE